MEGGVCERERVYGRGELVRERIVCEWSRNSGVKEKEDERVGKILGEE